MPYEEVHWRYYSGDFGYQVPNLGESGSFPNVDNYHGEEGDGVEPIEFRDFSQEFTSDNIW